MALFQQKHGRTMKYYLCDFSPCLLGGTAHRFLNPVLSNFSLYSKPITPVLSDKPAITDASQVQGGMHEVRPTSGTSQCFQEVPLSPLHDEDHLSNTSETFFHVPLEHEITASGSVWDGSAAVDEVNNQESITSMRLSRTGSHATAASSSSEYSSIAVVYDQKQELPSRMSAVPNPHSVCARTSDPLTPRAVSAGTLVETTWALDKTSGPTVAIEKVSFSSDSSRGPNWTPSTSESDISEGLVKILDPITKPKEPADLTISIPPAKVTSHAPFSRPQRPSTPSSSSSAPKLFEIPIPVFPFPAGTTRCSNRKCPIKGHHERGPYLHEGKLRSREGSTFGSSNPPPEIWFLYDKLREENFHSTGNKAFAPVELFAKYHFGETRGGYVVGSTEAGESVQPGAKQGGKKSRFLWFWS